MYLSGNVYISLTQAYSRFPVQQVEKERSHTELQQFLITINSYNNVIKLEVTLHCKWCFSGHNVVADLYISQVECSGYDLFPSTCPNKQIFFNGLTWHLTEKHWVNFANAAKHQVSAPVHDTAKLLQSLIQQKEGRVGVWLAACYFAKLWPITKSPSEVYSSSGVSLCRSFFT